MSIPVLVCTKQGKGLPVFMASMEVYAPDTKVIVEAGVGETFGEAYNTIMAEAFQTYDEVIIGQDDIVIRPDTMSDLLADVAELKRQGIPLGYVTARDEYACECLGNHAFYHNRVCVEAAKVAPIFAWTHKSAFERCPFPPTNWFSDDIVCADMRGQGLRCFWSRAYVHHVGGQSRLDVDIHKMLWDPIPWIRENRPEYLKWSPMFDFVGPR